MTCKGLRDQDSTCIQIISNMCYFTAAKSLMDQDSTAFKFISNVFYFTAASSSQKGNHHDRRGVVNYEDDDLFE